MISQCDYKYIESKDNIVRKAQIILIQCKMLKYLYDREMNENEERWAGSKS